MAESKKSSEQIQYKTISAGDRLVTARDFLRARETDHYRLFLSSPETDPSRDTRMEPLAEEIERLQKEVTALEKEVDSA